MSQKHPQLERITIKGKNVSIDGKIQKNMDGETCTILFPQPASHDRFDAIYLKDKHAVYYIELKIYRSKSEPKTHIREVTKDVRNFTVLDDGMLSKDKQHVYVWGKPVEGVDAKSFEMIPSHYFARDKHHVYYHVGYEPNFMPLVYANPKTFIPLQDKNGNFCEFGTDQDNLYFNWKIHNEQKWDFLSQPIFREGEMLADEFQKEDERIRGFIDQNKKMKGYWWSADYKKKPQDCRPLGSFHYAKSSTAVYTKNRKYDTPELINDADPKTFEPMTEQFSKDKNHVFYYGYSIPGVDPKSVKVLGTHAPSHTFQYIADASKVLCITSKYDEFHSFEITGADPKTFTVIDDIWTEDKHRTYKKGIPHKVTGSSKSTITKVNARFSKDRKSVYWDGKAITTSDPSTFEVLFDDRNQYWARDNVNLYNANGHRIVKGVDGGTFRMLDSIYGKDTNTVFSFASERLISTADAKTFEVIPETGLGKGKKNFFFMGKKITSKKYDDIAAKLSPFLKEMPKLKKKRTALWLNA